MIHELTKLVTKIATQTEDRKISKIHIEVKSPSFQEANHLDIWKHDREIKKSATD